jgi:hypothetical protein
MKHTFAMVAGIIIAAIGLTACSSSDVEVFGRELGTVIGHDAEAVHIDPGAVADEWHLAGPGVVSKAAGVLSNSSTWKAVNAELAEANEHSDIVRDVLVDAACESVRNNDYSTKSYEKSLEDNLFDKILPSTAPPEYELEETISELARTMQADAASGSAGQADVAVGCATWGAYSKLAS